MRKSVFIIAPLTLIALTGCTQEATEIEYRSTFDGGTKGLILHEDGSAGHAGMFSSNCPFDTETGQVTGDYDLPEEDEEVQDGEETTLGEVTFMAMIPGTMHVLDKTDNVYTHVPIEMEGVTGGRLLVDGVVGMTDDCEMRWIGLDGVETASTQLSTCRGDFEVDPATGIAIVSDPQRTVLTDGQSQYPSDVQGDLVAFDDVVQLFYVAQTGEARLSAVDMDGAERWTVGTDGPVTAMDDGGGTGTVGVVMELADAGAVAFYDGETGDMTRFAETPTAADDLAISGNGSVIALVRPTQAFFYAFTD